MDDFEKLTGMEGEQGVMTDDEPDMGATATQGEKRLADARFDPAILWSEVKSADWRVGSNAKSGGADAEGMNGQPAVRDGGIIEFLSPVPSNGHSNFDGDTGGGSPPWPCQLVRMGIELLCPPTRTAFWLEESPAPSPRSAHQEVFPAHAQMLATIIARGRFEMDMGDVPIFKDVPVSLIGASGGIYYSGDHFGAAQNQEPSWKNSFKLPDDLTIDPGKNTKIKARIKLNPADLPMLGKANEKDVWGLPFAESPIIVFSGSPPVESVSSARQLYFGVRLNFWGRRGLNIRAGRSSLVKAVASRR